MIQYYTLQDQEDIKNGKPFPIKIIYETENNKESELEKLALKMAKEVLKRK